MRRLPAQVSVALNRCFLIIVEYEVAVVGDEIEVI